MSIGGEPKLSDVHKNYKAKHCRIYKKSYLDVEDIISESPTQTPCLFSGISDLRPSSKIGIISGSTLSPSFFTRSPRVRAATYKRSFSNINLQSYLNTPSIYRSKIISGLSKMFLQVTKSFLDMNLKAILCRVQTYQDLTKIFNVDLQKGRA